MRWRITVEVIAETEGQAKMSANMMRSWASSKSMAAKVISVAEVNSGMPTIRAYTDGSAILTKGAPGGWGYRIEFPDGEVVESCGGVMGTTAQRMELTAVLEAAKYLRGVVHKWPNPTLFVVDSLYVKHGLEVWSPGWIDRGWYTAQGAPVANSDLWKKLLVETGPLDLAIAWQKGHVGHAGNERADQLAYQGRMSAAGSVADAQG